MVSLTDILAARPEHHRKMKQQSGELEINEKNQIEIFVMLIYLLNLEELPKQKSLFSKQYPFSFEVSRAIECMGLLKLAIELTTVTSTISYSVKHDMAFALLKKFFAAHLLHCPSSRTESVLTESMTVQVTPKGTALVYQFGKSMGFKTDKSPLIVKSLFNSIQLFAFDRSYSRNRNKVFYSGYLLHILLTQMMGPAPNVWSINLVPPMVDCLFSDDKHDFTLSSLSDVTQEAVSELGEKNVIPKRAVSPFHHKYFTNPESDAHIQYYESNLGIRVYHNKAFKTGKREVVVEYCFTGKSIVQWFMDCTMLSCDAEAIEIGYLLLKNELLVPITQAAADVKFFAHKEAYYILSSKGEQTCQWNNDRVLPLESLDSMDDANTISTTEEEFLKKPSLKTVILDPGMRHLFKLHMEKERCSENLDAYIELIEFTKLKSQLSRLLKVHARVELAPKKKRLATIIENQAGLCYSMAYHLYLQYLSLESLYDLNIGFGLRQEIKLVMTQAGRQNVGESPIHVETPLTEYMKTPCCDKLFELTSEAVQRTFPVTETSASSSGDVHTVASGSEKMLVAEMMAALSEIYKVFAKIASSIYRLMEVDSYPKFLRSDAYLYAAGIETHRS